MLRSFTYPHDKIGTLTRPTPEERAREGDRWVSLRTLHTTPAAVISPAAPVSNPPAPHTRALLHAVEARHAEARRKLNTSAE